MLDQTYTAKNFRRLIRPTDFSYTKHSLPSDKDKLDAKLLSVEKHFLAGKVKVSTLSPTAIGGKPVFTAGNFDTDIVLRKLNDNIRRLYTVRQPDRTEIVRQLIELLSDGTPIQIIRRDIKSFYESVPRERVTEKIKNDYLLSWESKRLLDDLFQSPMLAATQGLPRGIGLSATLSEIYMRRFDKTIGQMDGVLYYARYVDDIIILSFKNSESIISSIEDELRIMGLTLNAEKSPPPIELPDRSKALCSCHISCSCDQALEYLGYKISFPKQPAEWDKRRQGRFVCVSLSKRKLKRMKSRTARAFSDFCAGSSFALLTRRLQYLTSNYPLLLNKFKKGLKGGIYYHYPLLSDLSVLNELDRYLLALVFSKKGRLGKLLTKRLTDSDRTKLKKYSFVSGFKNRFFVRLTQAELSEIGKCWRYG